MNDLSTAKNAFDYSTAGVSPQIANRAKDAAARIRRLDEDARASLVEIGKELLWAKEAFQHGTFIDWIAAELGMSWSSANRYMNVAKNIDPKILTVSNLTPTTLYKLAAPATSPEYRAALVEAIERGGTIDEGEIKFDLREQKLARKQAQNEARKSPDAHKRQLRERERLERERAEEAIVAQRRLDEQQVSARQAIDLARSKLGREYPLFVEYVLGAGYSTMATLLKGDQEREREAKRGQAA